MGTQLIEFIEGIKSNKQVGSFDEASTKQAIVLRLLFLLGWDIFNVDEVNPNLATETQQADYALSIKSTRKVFIKVVRPNEALDKYQEKVFEYASKKGVDFAILTNGVIWWLYLSSSKGHALQNRFVVLDFLKQKVHEIEEQVTAFLKKDEISRDSAVKKAADILEAKLQQAAQKALPDAWFQILSEPHEALIRLVGETAEKICGFSAERNSVVKFLRERLKQPQPTEAPPVPHPEEKATPRTERVVPTSHAEEKTPSGAEKAAPTPLSEEKPPPRAEKAASAKQPKEKAPLRMEKAAPPMHLEEILETRIERAAPIPRSEEKAAPIKEKTAQKSYDGQAISSFSLRGRNYKIKSWEEFLVKLCDILKTEYYHDIDSLQWHPVGKKYYFNKNQNELRFPAGIAGTDLFVETYLNPNEMVKVALSVLNEFGFSSSDLVIS